MDPIYYVDDLSAQRQSLGCLTAIMKFVGLVIVVVLVGAGLALGLFVASLAHFLV